MRAAQPHELNAHTIPVLALVVFEHELPKWFPATFQPIHDPDALEGPSRGTVVALETGDYVFLHYTERSRQLTLRIPPEADGTAFLAAWFREVPLPHARVVWRRDDARLPPEPEQPARLRRKRRTKKAAAKKEK